MIVVKDKYRGMVAWTKEPAHYREMKGKFILDECSQEDLEYLLDMGYEGVERVEEQAEKKKKK